MRSVCVAFLISLASVTTCAGELVDLDTESPYYPHRNYPKLTTPQWVGEAGVDAVVILAIDDMKDHRRYEQFLRPILDRLKRIDGEGGRAPVSIMTNRIDPATPQVQQWLKEGLSIDAHTADHPCPILGGGDFERAKSTYDRCVDQLFAIPGNVPVAFRTPCCDSLNTPSPRLYAEVFNKATPGGRFLTIDSSVFNITTANDPELPRELVLDKDGRERFRKYVPFESFVNTIEDYPYPYVVGRLCWQFPCATPSDWQAQYVQKNANPKTTEDWKALLDVTVRKRGVMTMVFHPHGWSTAAQFVELIDHATAAHGKRVKFLTFREANDRLAKNLGGGTPLRDEKGRDNGVRLKDLNGDGYLDVLLTARREAYVWDAKAAKWALGQYPPTLRQAEEIAGDRRGHLRDLDKDGRSELIAGADVHRWDDAAAKWAKQPFALPPGTAVETGGAFVDVDEDGHDDLVFSNAERYGLYLFDSPEKGWARVALEGKRGDPAAKHELPPIIRADGTNNGMWAHSRTLWWQNEDTHKLANLVDRRTFNDLLKDVEPRAKSPAASLAAMKVAPGYRVELVAAEPLVMDPIAFAFGPDGKLWVVEMADYPLGLDGKGKPGGRVRYLEDLNEDGVYDKSTLFLDGLKFPTSVLPWRGGVLVTAAPEVFYAEDTDGDGKADRREVLLSGFKEGNQQHRLNHLSFGIDGWVYGANGDSGGTVTSIKTGKKVSISGRDFRFRPDTGEFEAVAGQSQFGRSRTDAGDWFGGNNANPLWHFPLDEHYLKRNPHVPPPPGVLRVDVPKVPGAAPVFPISVTRARFNDHHTANHFTSACSPHVYRDDLFPPPSAGGTVFIAEPVHNLVHRQVLTPVGATFTSARFPGEEKSEFLASSDSWFRPTTVATGPDGALYVADMYRAVIEHPEWIPKDWQARLDLRLGHDKGRIYRVLPVGAKRRPIPRMDRLDTAALVAALDTPGGWQRDLVQQMLVWRKDPAAVAPLEAMLRTAASPLARLHALAALDGLGRLAPAAVSAALADADPTIRRHAVRCAGQHLAESPDLQTTVGKLAADPDPHVRLQLAYTLGGWDDPRGAEALARLGVTANRNRFLLAAVASSLNAKNVQAVATAAVSTGAKEGPPSPALLAALFQTAIGTKAHGAIAATVQPLTTPPPGGFAAWQYQTLANLLDALDQANVTLTKLAEVDSSLAAAPAAVASATAGARTTVADAAGPAEARAAAVALLARDPNARAADLATFGRLLSPQSPREVQAAVITAVARRRDADAAKVPLAHWKGLTPDLRAAALDGLLARAETAALLLDTVEAKKVLPVEIDAARRQRLLHSPDKAVRARAAALLGESVNPDRQKVFDAFADAITLKGDATKGQLVFANACATCHRRDGAGNAVGPDLASVGDKSPQGLLVAILDPNRAVEPRFLNYVATTSDGDALTGLLASESGTSITLLGPDAKPHTLRRQDLTDLRSSNTSLMPDGLEANLKPQDLADLIAYVRAAR